MLKSQHFATSCEEWTTEKTWCRGLKQEIATTEDEIWWHHRLDGHSLMNSGAGWWDRGLVCFDSWSRKKSQDMTDWTNDRTFTPAPRVHSNQIHLSAQMLNISIAVHRGVDQPARQNSVLVASTMTNPDFQLQVASLHLDGNQHTRAPLRW